MRNVFLALFLALVVCSTVSGQDVQSATLVGVVTDPSGAVVPQADIVVTNTSTRVVSRGATNQEGAYYIPFLPAGTYDISIEAAGFKRFLRSGVILDIGQKPRIDARLEVGTVGETVEVSGVSPLLATDTSVVGGTENAEIIHDIPMVQSKPQHVMWYAEGSQPGDDGSYHVLGLPPAQIKYTIDGSDVKQTPTTAVGEVNNSVLPPVDSLMEAQVWTTGIPAEVGHASSGAYNMVTKSGTNDFHWSAEERYINKAFMERSIFNQTATNTPFEYMNFNSVVSGPVTIPKVYHGKDKTFFMIAFRFDYDHEQNSNTASVPSLAMLGGNFNFGAGSQQIYDPKSITCTNPNGCSSGTGWTATPFPGYQIPASRFDPVAVKFLSLNPYKVPDTAGALTTTGPANNDISNTHYLADRQGYLGRLDHELSSKNKLYMRFAWNRYRQFGRENVAYNWDEIDSTAMSRGEHEPIDTQNATIGDIHNFGPTVINEFRVAYQRRTDTNTPVLNNQGWAAILGIPGVGPQTFPGFVSTGGTSVTWTANPGGFSRTLQDHFEFADNVTKVWGAHTIKAGYQGLRLREDDITASQPSGVYNFSGAGSGLPYTPNTGNSFASFELGAVDSGSFTTLLANYLPRMWSHQLFVQDDWRAARNLTVSIGVRWSVETPTTTKYGAESEFNPTAIDPLTGLTGAITHPTSSFYKTDRRNFTPRVGLSYNFRPKWVFRGSFGMFTVDNLTTIGQEEYAATGVVQQVSGNPNPAFYLSQGPGPINYTLSSGSAVPISHFVGTNYSGRTATYIDPNLRNPYTMSFSAGFQYEIRPTTIAEVLYQGSSGVGLTGTTNINVLPQSIYQSTDTTLLNTVYANTQAYLRFPQFGAVTETSNFGHSTYNALVTRLEKRFSHGLTYSFVYTWSKNMTGGAGSGWQYYDWNLTKGLASTDVKFQFVSQASYQLPFGKDRRYMNRGGVANTILGGWNLLTIQSVRDGRPVTFSMAGNPNKVLPGETQPNLVLGQNIKVPNYSIGNLWPQQTQNPYFNINAFSYPAAFTPGDAGVGIVRFGSIWWPQYSLAKTVAYRERFKITVRIDANNLFPRTHAWAPASGIPGPNTTVNLTSPTLFGKFGASTTYCYSNWYTENGHLVGVLRLEF